MAYMICNYIFNQNSLSLNFEHGFGIALEVWLNLAFVYAINFSSHPSSFGMLIGVVTCKLWWYSFFNWTCLTKQSLKLEALWFIERGGGLVI